MSKLDREKVQLVYTQMKKYDIDAWIITGRETIMSDEPVLKLIGNMSFIIQTALIFTKEKLIAVVSPLDVDGYRLIAGIDEVVEYPGTPEDTMADVLKELKPQTIALDFSQEDSYADGLTGGMKRSLDTVFEKIGFHGSLVSSEPIVQALH